MRKFHFQYKSPQPTQKWIWNWNLFSHKSKKASQQKVFYECISNGKFFHLKFFSHFFHSNLHASIFFLLFYSSKKYRSKWWRWHFFIGYRLSTNLWPSVFGNVMYFLHNILAYRIHLWPWSLESIILKIIGKKIDNVPCHL